MKVIPVSDSPLFNDLREISKYAKQRPIFLLTVESDKSLCNLEICNLFLTAGIKLFDKDKFPSAFSKSIGLTLCGIVDEPTSVEEIFCLR